MSKSHSDKIKSKSNPGKLSKTGKKAGIELTETELGQASGGTVYDKWKFNPVV